MSRPRYYWHPIVRKMVMRYPKLNCENSIQEKAFKEAIETVKEKTFSLSNGDCRVEAVEDILIKKTKTVYGVSQEMNYSWKTVQNWVNTFIRMVGKEVGY